MKFVSLDIETGGLDHVSNPILEIGAIVEDTDTLLPYAECPRMRILVDFRKSIGSIHPVAEEMNRALIGEIDGTDPCWLVREHNVLEVLDAWLREQGFNKDNKATLAGKNVFGFDLPFLKARGGQLKQPLPIHHRHLDPGTMFVKASDAVPPSTEECAKRAGIILGPKHSALADAWDVIRMVRRHFGLHSGHETLPTYQSAGDYNQGTIYTTMRTSILAMSENRAS